MSERILTLVSKLFTYYITEDSNGEFTVQINSKAKGNLTLEGVRHGKTIEDVVTQIFNLAYEEIERVSEVENSTESIEDYMIKFMQKVG